MSRKHGSVCRYLCMVRLLTGVVVAVGLTACSTPAKVPDGRPGADPVVTEPAARSEQAFPEVTGTVTYRERVALSPTAVVMVRLLDASVQDAPAILIGEQLIPTRGRQVPFRFAIPYVATAIDPRGRYVVQARIEDRDRLLFITDRAHPVITRQGASHVDLVLRAIGNEIAP